MCMYTCSNCNKQFKTTQHLNQHKNRKKSCVNASNASCCDVDSNNSNSDVSNEISRLRKSLQYFEELEAQKNKLEAENARLMSQINIINSAIQVADLPVCKIKKTDKDRIESNKTIVSTIKSIFDDELDSITDDFINFKQIASNTKIDDENKNDETFDNTSSEIASSHSDNKIKGKGRRKKL